MGHLCVDMVEGGHSQGCVASSVLLAGRLGCGVGPGLSPRASPNKQLLDFDHDQRVMFYDYDYFCAGHSVLSSSAVVIARVTARQERRLACAVRTHPHARLVAPT